MARDILIAEDNPTDRTRLEDILRNNGYQVRSVENGAQALEAVERSKPDVVLMDVNMPEMDGFAATRALRDNPETNGIPVVMVTAKGQKADKAWGQMLGAKGYITKPYADDEVLSVVRSL